MLAREIETARLRLRPWRVEDAKALFPLASDPTIGLNAGWNPHRTLEETRAIIRGILTREHVYAITRLDGTLIGSISADTQGISILCHSEREIELGYWIGTDYQGRGYGKEAAKALLDEAKRCGFEVAWASYFPGNSASKGLLKSLAFTYVDTQVFQFPQLEMDRAVNIVTKRL